MGKMDRTVHPGAVPRTALNWEGQKKILDSDRLVRTKGAEKKQICVHCRGAVAGSNSEDSVEVKEVIAKESGLLGGCCC